MAKSNPTRPGAPRDEKRVDDGSELPDTDGPALKDPRSIVNKTFLSFIFNGLFSC